MIIIDFIRQERALFLLSLLGGGLLLFRMLFFSGAGCEEVLNPFRCDRLLFLFLGWNLFLAWVPLVLGYGLRRTKLAALFRLMILLFWLLFFPNAPYLMTDLIHLRPRAGVPLWFDAALLFFFAYLGLRLGVRALVAVREYLRERHGTVWADVGTTAALLLSGLGIYLGRVLRWNSWDALLRPRGPLGDTLDLLLHPFANAEAWLMIGTFTIIFAGVYWSENEERSTSQSNRTNFFFSISSKIRGSG